MYVVTQNFLWPGLLRKPELHLAHPLKYLKMENIGFEMMDDFFSKTHVIFFAGNWTDKY